MANPTSCGIGTDYKPALASTDSSEVAVTLNPLKSYILFHTGLDGTTAGSADTTPVYLAFNGTVAVAVSAGSANKAILPSLQTLEIGPGLTEVSFITANASDEPGVVISPQRNTLGRM